MEEDEEIEKLEAEIIKSQKRIREIKLSKMTKEELREELVQNKKARKEYKEMLDQLVKYTKKS